jgi:hypothetical protein
LERKLDEGILHPGTGIVHLYAGAENSMTYKVMTLSAYLESLDNDTPMNIIAPFLQLRGMHLQTTELLLSEIQKYKRRLAEATRAPASRRMLDTSADEPGSDDNDDLSDLGAQLGDHLSLLEIDGEDIYGAHRTQAF